MNATQLVYELILAGLTLLRSYMDGREPTLEEVEALAAANKALNDATRAAVNARDS